jgi:peptidoglycan hydrolase CwlO-like protein
MESVGVLREEMLAVVMGRYGIEWAQKGTHEKHLSVLDYEKKMRSAEVVQLETRIEDLQANMQDAQKSADNVQAKLERLQERENLINLNVGNMTLTPTGSCQSQPC